MEIEETRKRLLLSENKKVKVNKQAYKIATTSDNLYSIDLYLTASTNEYKLATKLAMNEFFQPSNNLNLAFISDNLTFNFNEDTDEKLVSSFVEDIVNFNYQYNSNLSDRYAVLNYLAFILVNAELENYYIGGNLPLITLMQELISIKPNNYKLTVKDLSEYLTHYRFYKCKDKFEETIAVMRKFVWQSL